MTEALRTLALAALLLATWPHDGVVAQETEGEVLVSMMTLETDPFVRGDMIEVEPTPEDPDTDQNQMEVWPTMGPEPEVTETTVAPETVTVEDEEEEAGVTTPAAPEEGPDPGAEAEAHRGDRPQTQAPLDPREPPTTQAADTVLIPEADVVCVSKEKVQDRDAVSLTLKTSSSCEDTRLKIKSVLEHLCGVDCKLEVYQEDDSNQILISGQYIDEDAKGMADKFNNDNIKDKIDVEDASPRWGRSSRVVLVSLLLSGLLLAALLVAGYYLKTHRGKTAKGVRLAESFQVDEENQANTLVSVAPLQPQEPGDKPTTNGESPPDDGRSQVPTNGHSATQTPVADTQM